MTITVAILRAAGITPEQIARVCEIEESERILERREKNRKYQQNHRARGQLRPDRPDTPLPPFSLKEKVSPTPPLKENTLFPPTPSRQRQMPTDFVLSEADCNFARQRGWDDSQIKSGFEHFCDHAAAKGRKLIDWHAGWRTWVQSPYNSGKANGHVGSKRKTTGDVCDELLADIRSKMAGTPDSGGGEQGRQTDDVGLFGVLPVQPRVPDVVNGSAVPIPDGGGNVSMFARPRRS